MLIESINDALIECVKALGGSKQVGPLIWPECTPEAAQRKLLDCLNHDRPQHLTPEQVVFVARKARERGCHALVAYLAADLSYAPPVPIEPRDELADLLRQYLSRREQDATDDARLQRMVAAYLAPKAA